MASRTAMIVLLMLLVVIVVPTPASAAVPTYGKLYCIDAWGGVVPGTISDNDEYRFTLLTQNVPDNHIICVDIARVAGPDWYTQVQLQRGANGLYDCPLGYYYHAPLAESTAPDAQRYRYNDTTSGDVGPWEYIYVSPVRDTAPSVRLTDVTVSGTVITVDLWVTWSRVSLGSERVMEWIPASGEPIVLRNTVQPLPGNRSYAYLSPDSIPYGTPGWWRFTAVSQSGASTSMTRPLPTPAPTATPTATATVTVVPTTVAPTTTTTVTLVPTVIPTGILTYPTPLPTISPTPEVTPVPVGTLAYEGIPRWSSAFRLQAQPLPTLPGPHAGAAPQPVPVYIDAPQWTNFTVPRWLYDPVPVVGPAVAVTDWCDTWVDAAIHAVISPVDAIVSPIVVWMAKLAAGIGDAIGALGTWISGIAIYARGFGDCYWVLIPLPVWVVAAIAVWWRLLHVVLAFLSSEQYTWLFEVKH